MAINELQQATAPFAPPTAYKLTFFGRPTQILGRTHTGRLKKRKITSATGQSGRSAAKKQAGPVTHKTNSSDSRERDADI